jgi:16S rRNA C967 or C1407 C5-methylase (RsmB/RsmF family)
MFSMGVKGSIEQWLEQLKAEKSNIESRIAQGELNLEVSQVKYNIASRAQNRLPHNSDRRAEFAEKFTNPLEKAYEAMLDNYEKIKQQNQAELHYVNTLISQVEESLKGLED